MATNLLANPGAESAITGWTGVGSGSTVTRVTTDAHSGVACVEVVCDGAGASQGASQLSVSGSYTPGMVVRGEVWVKSDAGRSIRALIREQQGSGQFTSVTATMTGDWQLIQVSRELTQTSTRLQLRIDNGFATAAYTMVVDDAILWVPVADHITSILTPGPRPITMLTPH